MQAAYADRISRLGATGMSVAEVEYIPHADEGFVVGQADISIAEALKKI
jgi:hypothetical protein